MRSCFDSRPIHSLARQPGPGAYIAQRAMLLAGGLALLVSACMVPKRVEPLGEALRSYNEAVRWQRFDIAAARVPAGERDDFLDLRDELGEDLRVSEYDVIRTRYDESGRRAKVQVKYTWHLDSRGLVHTTHTVQRWERPEKTWMLLSEVRLRGDAMPGIDEPEEHDSPSDTAPDATPHSTFDQEGARNPAPPESPKRVETRVHALRKSPR